MAKNTTFCTDILKAVLNGVAIADLLENDTTGPLTNLYVSAHTADPTITGDQTTNEATYTSYARVAVARDSGSPAWTVTSGVASPVAAITWPACTGGTNTITHFAIGTASTGAGKVLYVGTVTPNISVSSGVTPSLTTASTLTET